MQSPYENHPRLAGVFHAGNEIFEISEKLKAHVAASRRDAATWITQKAFRIEKADITFFDPKADWTVVERGLPHWSQAGCVCFVTWGLNDALPVEVRERIEREIETLLIEEGLDPQGNWKEQLFISR